MNVPTMSGTAHERVIQALNDHGSKSRRNSWQCPAHPDNNPSLSVNLRKSGDGVVLYCHAGCSPEDVAAALGLAMTDLFDEPIERRERPQVVAEYPYCDERGELLMTVKRYEPGYDGERKTFRQYRADGSAGVSGVRRVLYRLPEVLAAAKDGGPVFIVEGEKDADNLSQLVENGRKVVATCSIGGAGKWRDEYTASLKGVSEVLIIADKDAPGRKHAAQVAASVAKAGIPFRVFEAAKGKDVSDHLAHGLGYEDLIPVQLAARDDAEGLVPSQPGAPDAEGDPYPGRLPEAFWSSRKVFQRIRQYAHSEAASADTALFMCLARLSGMVSHHYRAVTGIGGRASLNTFAATVGGSGAGKTTSVKVARELMPAPEDEDFRDGLPLGSGEGMAEVYMGTAEVETGEIHQRGPNKGDPVVTKVRKQVRHNAFFYVDEGETIAKLADRNGSTLGEALRRAAIGETLGQANATEDRSRYVPEGSYSMGLMVGFQPKTAMPLLADAATGTPQRFLWCWAEDNTIPYEEIAKPDVLRNHPGLKRPTGPIDITFPESIRKELRHQRVAKARGDLQVSELDAHGPLMKVKVSALLALLDNREFVNEEDWHLAEIIWQSSCAVRDHLIEKAKRQEAAERQRLEEAQVEQAVKAHSAKSGHDTAVLRVARKIHRMVVANGKPMNLGDVRKGIAYRDREPYMRAAIDHAEASGWIVLEDGKVSAAG